jgi:hypothetical protein
MGRLGCRVGWWALAAGGLLDASTVRPDPSTLGAAGERGSRREDRLRSVPGLAHLRVARNSEVVVEALVHERHRWPVLADPWIDLLSVAFILVG